jgi:hypothetical protein
MVMRPSSFTRAVAYQLHEGVLMNLPKHKCGLYLEHNAHRDVYEKADAYLADSQYGFKSDADKERAIETDEIWTLQWYPHTPVGFHAVAAPTLDELLAFAAEIDADEST